MNVVITGPESCGKSTLAQALCRHFTQSYEDEFSRQYLDINLTNRYTQADLKVIAQGQLSIQERRSHSIDAPIIHDTDLLTIKIWSDLVFGDCDPFIINTYEANLPELYLICDYNIPWQPDPLRENPMDRAELFEIYLGAIIELKIPFVTLYGDNDQRLRAALMAIKMTSIG